MKRILALPKSVLVVALCCAMIATACTASQISAYINLAAQISLNVLQIASAASGTPVSAHDSSVISQLSALMQSSVTAFEANKSAGNSALVSVAEAAQANIPAFIAAAQFDNAALGARVSAAATSFLTIVESIATIVSPGTVVAPAPAPVAMRAGGTFSMPARVVVSPQSIANQWNTQICAGASAACRVVVR